MAHEITRTDQLVLNSGEAAWHGLGVVVNQELSPGEAVRMALPWEPKAVPLYYRDLAGNERRVTDYVASVRDDNDDQLGIVGEGFGFVKNAVFGEFAEALAGADAAVRVETCGSLMGGKRVFMTARIPATIRVGRNGDDQTANYLVLSNAHDGTAAFFAMWTAVRVVCANTHAMALGARFEIADAAADNGRAFRFRHTGNIMDRIAEAKRMLAIATSDVERYQVLADELARTAMKDADIAAYWKAVYIGIYGPRPAGPKEKEQGEAWDIRLAKRSEEWNALLADPKQRIAGIGGTAWAALQAVNEWHTHVRSATRVTGDRRLHSNLFGESARDKRGAIFAAAEFLRTR